MEVGILPVLLIIFGIICIIAGLLSKIGKKDDTEAENKAAEKLTKKELAILRKELMIDKMMAKLAKKLNNLLANLANAIKVFYRDLKIIEAKKMPSWAAAKFKWKGINKAIKLSKEIDSLIKQEFKDIARSTALSNKAISYAKAIEEEEADASTEETGVEKTYAVKAEEHELHVMKLEAYRKKIRAQETRILQTAHGQINVALKKEFLAAKDPDQRDDIIDAEESLKLVNTIRGELRIFFRDLQRDIQEIRLERSEETGAEHLEEGEGEVETEEERLADLQKRKG